MDCESQRMSDNRFCELGVAECIVQAPFRVCTGLGTEAYLVFGEKTRVPTNHQTVKVGGVVVPYHYMFTTYTEMLQHAQFGK